MSTGTLIAQGIFWGCVFLVFYTYFLYPIVLFLFYSVSQIRRDWKYLGNRRDRRVSVLTKETVPGVTVILPAHNEQARLPRAIQGLVNLDYPRERLEVIFVSDGSTDGTNDILKSIEGLPSRNIFLAE